MTPILALAFDPWILAFSAITVGATLFMGFWTARRSKTASDFFVAGRSVSVGWNASAISGEYLSAASFMGVAGMVMSSGYDALWYPVCYACGYLFLLLFIAGPLRRFGAYTIPDFAEGRFDSPVFRKIAVVFVLFIGFFYTMPQMKGAGTTLAYIFPGLPYWAGVVLVGAVITLNVALGGMKGITLVQAVQYWAKMFAISVPIFVLMAVYGGYGKQLAVNAGVPASGPQVQQHPAFLTNFVSYTVNNERKLKEISTHLLGDAALKDKAATVADWIKDAPAIDAMESRTVIQAIGSYNAATRHTVWVENSLTNSWKLNAKTNPVFGLMRTLQQKRQDAETFLDGTGISLLPVRGDEVAAIPKEDKARYARLFASWSSASEMRKPLPVKAPADSTWLSPFGPLTTKAAKAAAAAIGSSESNQASTNIHPRFRLYLPPYELSSYGIDRVSRTNLATRSVHESLTLSIKRLLGLDQKVNILPPGWTNITVDLAFQCIALTKEWEIVRIEDWHTVLVTPPAAGYAGLVIPQLIRKLKSDGIEFQHLEGRRYLPIRRDRSAEYGPVADLLKRMAAPKGPTPQAWLAKHEKPLALLYTYSLIIALVCGTAGLPHILVRFYTNPDGVAAKRTTMWVMILIGIFYVFPPVFGVLGRNLMPELYNGLTGVKGTDGIVLKLPTILREKYGVLGSILSGVTCAGAFAAFMSTFSGLLVSMTGALAHDVYGRMLKPKSTSNQRLRAFKVCAVLIGGIAIVLGCFVEPLEINFMVGQAFAIAAASYFPLLFMSVWWRGMTMRGAALGMLAGGLCALAAVALTNVSNLALDKGPMGKVFASFGPMNDFWAHHPLLRILCEQPAIWTVPLAIGLMIIVSKLTRNDVPGDVRMKMLVLHAPEKLGLKQEYIQEHQGH